ncbi:MAG TPA: SpoIIE family protein phosphatase [Leptospiraceae bacterium]|nr:SpoIIE family protein phosphatase [Leptospiraceae bacterium]HMW08509.1 SpoIIE family protein phosphatase [Leptospiraceae bacterium]HMX31956.1 SpoIIE family protein phosphatase [Leptospiraceae bacterium]HMY33627.1 SpoIIE family protein phosphatase [Leptospiraceae bacterium]HMZ66459.1 SpoIIE family protein phosphatase [Leptospiraceae bacterium]
MNRKDLTIDRVFEINSRINSSHDLNSLLDTIMETIKDVLNTEGCSLLLYLKEEDCLYFHTSKGEKSDLLPSMKVPRGRGIAGLVLETLEPVIVNDAQQDDRIYREIDKSVGFVTKNLICVPMVAQGEVQGVVEAVNTVDRDSFEEYDIHLLQNLSIMAAIAIRNRILVEDLESKYNEIQCLLKVSQALQNINNIEQFLEVAFRSALELINVERFSFAYKSRSKGNWRLVKTYGFTLDPEYIYIDASHGVIGHIIRTGEPLLVTNTDETKLEFLYPENYKSKSFISIPIFLNSEIFGILSVSDKKNKKAFNSSDLHLLIIISNHILEAYKALLSKEKEKKLEAIHRDLQIASKIQLYSLPVIPKKLKGMQVESFYQSSREIGGDFYDLIYHGENEFSALIADVSGKGIPAALFMEFSKTILASEVHSIKSPAKSLHNANQILKEKFNYMMLVEVMLLRIFTNEKKFIFASAGHNRQFYYKKSSGKVNLLSGKGIPLGTRMQNFEISETTVSYNSGDLIILYTDGITETMNHNKEMFGEERFIELIENNAELPLESLKDLIKLKTDEFRGRSENLEDDCTLLLIRLE